MLCSHKIIHLKVFFSFTATTSLPTLKLPMLGFGLGVFGGESCTVVSCILMRMLNPDYYIIPSHSLFPLYS